MKKVYLILVALIVFFSACSNAKSEESVSGSDIRDSSTIDKIEWYYSEDEELPPILYIEGAYDYNCWNSDYGVHEVDAVPDIETALNVAKAIYAPFEKRWGGNRVPRIVDFDVGKEVWIVCFSEYSGDPDNPGSTLDGGFCVAIQKKDGKVLRTWYE